MRIFCFNLIFQYLLNVVNLNNELNNVVKEEIKYYYVIQC